MYIVPLNNLLTNVNNKAKIVLKISNTFMQNILSPLFLIFFFFTSTASLCAGYGDAVGGYPNMKEREILVATNAVRTAPQEFRDKYIGDYDILLPTNYPPVDPIYLNHDLSVAARVHSEDMAHNCGLQHNSCDSTNWLKRITSYYTDNGWVAENIAAGYSSGFNTIIQFLRDDSGNLPAADNSASDNHRANIMNAKYPGIGNGYAYGSRQWYHFWTQDFGGGEESYFAIPSGVHLHLKSDTISFMATYFDPNGLAPQAAEVVINNVAHQMELHLGSATRGTYLFELPEIVSCQEYYFRFRDAVGEVWRYPASTLLSTSPGGSCITLDLSDVIQISHLLIDGLTEEGAISVKVDIDGDQERGMADVI